MIGFGYGIGISPNIASLVSLDPDAQAFITAAAITDATQKTAINTLVVDLKLNSLWTKFKAIYPFIGNAGSQQKFNLKDPRDLDAAFRLQFNGGATFPNGYLPNGSNGYADTFFIGANNLTSPSASFGLRFKTMASRNAGHGVVDDGGSTKCMYMYPQYSDNTSYNVIGYEGGVATYGPNFASNVTNGFIQILSRTSTTSIKSFRDGVQKAENVINGGSLLPTIYTFTIGAVNAFGAITAFDNKEITFGFLADGLNNAEINLFTTIELNFQTTLARL